MSHVALVIPGFDRMGGAERQLLLMASGLCRRHWRVSVVALSGAGGAAAAELARAGVSFYSLEMRKGLADPHGWIRFHRWLRQVKPDVLHAHLPHAAWLARWSRLAAPVRVLVDTLHSSFTGSPGRRLGYRYSAWLPDRVTAVSLAVAEAHLLARMVSTGKLTVLPNGVDVHSWRPDAEVRAIMRRELGLENEFLWLAAGRLDPVKDYPTLLSALVQIPESSILAIAGSGPLQHELLQLSTQLGLDRRVRFLGFEPDVLRWMQAADGFVLSSLWEGLPMGLLEAAACALPAVATDVPGTREAVIDEQTGWLASVADLNSLADAMAQLMQTPQQERRAMGERARRHVTERFSMEVVLDRWETLYEEFLQRNPIPIRWSCGN